MKKLIALILILTLLALCGCTGTANSNISVVDLKQTMLDAAPNLPEMSYVNGNDSTGKDSYSYLSDFAYAKTINYFYAYSSKGSADEIAVIVLKNASDAADAEKSLKDHVDKRVKLFATYSPEQVDRAKNAEIFSKGNLVAMIMCDDCANVKAAFLDFVSSTSSANK